MNTKTSFLFQFSEYKWAVPIFYLVSLLIMGTSITFSDGSSVSGLEVATCFFLLVCGMNFQSTLMFHLQMGSTRRTLFKGWLLSSFAVCLMTAALNLAVLLISQLIGIPMVSPLFAIPIASVVLRMAVGLLYQFATFFLFISLGYLLSLLFYRLNKMGRWIAGILLGGILLSLLYYLAQFDSMLDRLYMLPYQHPLLSSSIYLLISLVILSLCWLMIRAAPIK